MTKGEKKIKVIASIFLVLLCGNIILYIPIKFDKVKWDSPLGINRNIRMRMVNDLLKIMS